MKIHFVVALIVIGCIAYGCQKDADDGGGNKTKTELISSAAWKYDTAAIDANDDGTTDQALPPGFIENCDRDNTITLKKDSTGTIDAGASKCGSEPQTTSFNWQFKNNETVISIPTEVFGVSGDFTIMELTDTKLRLSKKVTYTVVVPITVTVIVTLKH